MRDGTQSLLVRFSDGCPIHIRLKLALCSAPVIDPNLNYVRSNATELANVLTGIFRRRRLEYDVGSKRRSSVRSSRRRCHNPIPRRHQKSELGRIKYTVTLFVTDCDLGSVTIGPKRLDRADTVVDRTPKVVENVIATIVRAAGFRATHVANVTVHVHDHGHDRLAAQVEPARLGWRFDRSPSTDLHNCAIPHDDGPILDDRSSVADYHSRALEHRRRVTAWHASTD